MNLCFLVEGNKTEKQLYRSWLGHTFPTLTRVDTISEMNADTYCVIKGGGIPLYLEQLRDVLLDIKDNPLVDHLFVCIDAEDLSYEERLAELDAELCDAETKTRVRERNPKLNVHLIVQNCCIETWFLGHSRMMRQNPSSERLREFQRFYDVRESDPELMEFFAGFRNRADFHYEYLKAMLLEQNPGLHYTKKRPGVVLEKHYLDALRERCNQTSHLPSLGKLLTTWDALA